MKGNEALTRSYKLQKEIFEEARDRRVRNRNAQIEKIQTKINNLQAILKKLESQNKEEKEFESFESFRRKAETQSLEQKKPETEV